MKNNRNYKDENSSNWCNRESRTKNCREALQRGHNVTAIVRSASKVTANIPVMEKDVFELSQEDVKDFDVGAPFGQEELHVKAGRHLIGIFTSIHPNYLLSVCG